jgi:hypothetical protein
VTRLLLFLLLCLPLTAQGKNIDDKKVEISGCVEDSATHNRLANASVTLLRGGKPLKFARTKDDGTFTITIAERQPNDSLQATLIGYRKQRVAVSPGNTVIAMASTAFVLKEVQVKGSRISGRDTITYDLTRFANERDNNLKDVLKKLPGVDIDKDGTINYNGKAINRFTVEGLDLTGGRYNQLEENIRAKDVKKAEIIEHDQPIKALQKRTYTDNVAMNIALKDSARDKLTLTLKPYLLVGDPTHVGGSANMLQIGKKKQMMYDTEYDRSGKNLAYSTKVLASYGDRLSAFPLPSWLSAPSLEAPIDAERLRFNTSQKYSVNHLTKNKKGTENRLSAGYVRTVERQQTANTSVYNLGGDTPITTTENNNKTMTADDFNVEWENKVNETSHYGNSVIKLNVCKDDGQSVLNDTLTQRIRTPQVNLEGSIYRLFTLKNSMITWRSAADYHHGNADLDVNNCQDHITTNLWHTAHNLLWQKITNAFTQRYRLNVDAKNIHTAQKEDGEGKQVRDNVDVNAQFLPFWQYKTETFRMLFSPSLGWERFTRQHKTLWTVSPYLYIYKKIDFRQEVNMSAGYSTSKGSTTYYCLDNYRKSYRSWFQSAGIVPITRTLYATLNYDYKRPIRELFISAAVNASRLWMNTATDLQIIDGNYYTSVYEQQSNSNSLRASFYISKGFHKLNLKTRLKTSYTRSQGEQYSSGNAIDYTTSACTLTPSIEFSPSWCNFLYEGTFSFYDSERQNTLRSSLFNWKQSLSATATIRQFDLTFSLVHYRNQLQQGNTLNTLLGDAEVVWRMKSVRLSAELRNIFNKKSYVETLYSGISTVTDSYQLRPRELMLTAQFSL